MFARVHPPTEIKGGNKGSCYDLATYLNKEQGVGQHFFSHTEDNVTVEDVIININNNKKAIGKDEAKFYMVSLNPSEAEQRHLIGRNVNDISELSEAERQTVFRKLETFTRSAMNEYAKNFERDNIRSGADLMYYARIETQRIYKPEDEEVKSGAARIGEVKPGLNFHVHVIVSRKSLDGKTKLSPAFGKSAGNEWELEGRGTVKRGFSHEKFKVSVQNSFNQEFNYQSTKEETYIIKKAPEQDIIDKISNPDLKQLLTDTHFTAANQIVSVMKEKGYNHQVRKGIHTFGKDGQTFQVAHSELKAFERPLSDSQLKSITDRFDLAEYENGAGKYDKNGLTVKNIAFSTWVKDENVPEGKSLKDVSYKVIYDKETNSVVSFSTVKQFAHENKINLIKSDLNTEIILKRVKNTDLKQLLTNQRFTAANQIVSAMREKGYDHQVRKGIHTFTHSNGNRISILHRDLNRFCVKVESETMRDIATRFNAYKFNRDHDVTGYSENGLSSKKIGFYTYVSVPGEPQAGTDPENKQGSSENAPQDPQKKVAQEKVLKYVEYEVICDSHTKTTVPVSEIRKFARENDIILYDRFKHSYAVSNPDLRECLSNPDLTTRKQINQEMRKRGYTVSTDEKGNYTYTKNGSSFSMSGRDLGAFTNYAKDSADKQSSHSSGSGRGEAAAGTALNMTVGNVTNKVTNEILGENFKTERQIVGKVKTAVTLVTNPASVKMMLLRKIASYLNPLKEM